MPFLLGTAQYRAAVPTWATATEVPVDEPLASAPELLRLS